MFFKLFFFKNKKCIFGAPQENPKSGEFSRNNVMCDFQIKSHQRVGLSERIPYCRSCMSLSPKITVNSQTKGAQMIVNSQTSCAFGYLQHNSV